MMGDSSYWLDRLSRDVNAIIALFVFVIVAALYCWWVDKRR